MYSDEHVDAQLPAMIAGTLVNAGVDSHLAKCRRCTWRREGLIARAALLADSVRDPAALRAHLELMLREIEEVPDPATLIDPVVELFDIPPSQARDWLRRAVSGGRSRWIAGPAPGVRLLLLRSSARMRRRVHTLCVRLAPLAAFPLHYHAVPEHVLVVQGAARDNADVQVWRGETRTYPVGSSHSPVAMDGVDCVALIRLDL